MVRQTKEIPMTTTKLTLPLLLLVAFIGCRTYKPTYPPIPTRKVVLKAITAQEAGALITQVILSNSMFSVTYLPLDTNGLWIPEWSTNNLDWHGSQPYQPPATNWPGHIFFRLRR
jgi:hypothetical protein